MNKLKKHVALLSTVLILLITLTTVYYSRKPLLQATSNWLTAQTIPFNWLVNPQKVNKNIHPHAITLNEIDNQEYQTELAHVDTLIHSFNRQKQKSTWLSPAQFHQLQGWVHQKPHRYIYSVTPLLIGYDHQGKYTVLSANRYDDTKQIRSYRYQVYFRQHQVLKTSYLGSTSNNKAPKFIGFTNKLGNSGISKAPNFLDNINTTLTNSDIINQPNASTQQYSQLGKNIGLSTHSGAALQRYAQMGTANQKNSAIIGYEISDVPRETFFFITQINKEKTYYYTLIYNRNQNRFIAFEQGKKSIANRP
ncbi:hypothetical protein [Bombilactobacillus bombi]|uniref:hypothetical protein n=1 Tax=Bombilactobacillus bombi TaxID=1303590 RepID=UPI0015E607B0|nr:hypothetical protein [Bombilactobacillus bombi]MBA1433746.1 hypothetical protein [Bombilactobacillus bombi]